MMEASPRSRTAEARAATRGIDATLYRRIAGNWLTGVAVVTSVTASGRPVGLTVNAVSPLSLDPPQFLVNLDHASESLKAIRETGVFCINFLGADQEPICRTFARKGIDKFASIGVCPGVTGAPVLTGTIAHAECRVEVIHGSGDHSIVIGSACAGEAVGGEPLVYFTSNFRILAACS